MTQFQIQITMTDDTVSRLVASGSLLYGFKAVQGADAAALPLVWFRTDDYAASTIICWVDQYRAYTSKSELAANSQIRIGSSYAITLQQMLRIDNTAGTGTVIAGTTGLISFDNTTPTALTCGVEQLVDLTQQAPSPLIAFPVYGGHVYTVTPIESVLLMFSSQQIAVGTAIQSLAGFPNQKEPAILADVSPGVLIDLAGAPQNQRAVSYDINTGWTAESVSWMKPVPAGADLVPFLIQSA